MFTADRLRTMKIVILPKSLLQGTIISLNWVLMKYELERTTGADSTLRQTRLAKIDGLALKKLIPI